MVGKVTTGGRGVGAMVGASTGRHPRTPIAPSATNSGHRGASGNRQGARQPEQPKPASEAARRFLTWLREHDECRDRCVDDVWYLAEADFAEALDVKLPPRRVFLGDLQKLEGVRVTYDRRVYDRAGRVVRKTTFYSFAQAIEPAALPPMKLAA